MSIEPVENETELLEITSSPGENLLDSGDGDTPARDAAVGLALYTASTAWNSVSSAFRLTGRLGGFFLSPVKRVVDSSTFEPVRSKLDKLIARGETEVDDWIQTGLSQEAPAREAARNVVDPLINDVVGYLSTHPAIQKLVKDQIEQLARESPELPQINVLVRVLADNYITYLNENPEQVKALVQNQADVYIDHLQENPEQVQDLVQGQSVSMLGEITDEVRERVVTADTALEALIRRLFRRPPRAELPEPPPMVQARALQARLPEDFPRLEAMRHDDQ